MPGTTLLLQLDGKIPNLALMRIAAARRTAGDRVTLRRAGNAQAIQRQLGEEAPERVYASAIFTRTRPLAELVRKAYPQAVLGGTGWSTTTTLADAGIEPNGPIDYSDYPRWSSSIGYSQRGCRLRCPFCIVPKAEGAVSETATIADIWRGGKWPRHVLLLDNDFLGQPRWRERIEELRTGRYRVSFNQGINARLVDRESAAAIAGVDYRDDGMRHRRLYTAFDNAKDAERFFRGVGALIEAGVRPHHLFVYMLIGYWKQETHQERDWRRRQIRSLGALPYPMPFRRTPELIGFARWVIGGYDRTVPWEIWEAARYQPARLRLHRTHERALPLTGETQQ